MSTKDISASRYDTIDNDVPDQDRKKVHVDYGQRKRSVEWRSNWFQIDRPDDEQELSDVLRKALRHKTRLIKEQISVADHLAAYAPAGAGTPWFSIGPRNVNGRVKSITVHPTNPDILYAGAVAGGVWKSTDGGQSWRPLWNEQESLVVGSVAIAPSQPNTIYAGTGEWTPGYILTYPGAGLYVSTDGGASWTQQAGLNATRISKVVVSPTDANRVYVAGNSGFERSTDGGATWTTVRSGQISDAVIDPNNADIIYIAIDNDGIYKSTDGGTTWSLLSGGPTGASADWLKLAIGDAGASGSNFLLAKGGSFVQKSTDGGATWSAVGGSHSYSWHGWSDMLAVAPDDEDIIMVGGNWAQRTDDGGSTWNNLSGLHADHHMAVFAPSNPNIVYECNDGGVYRSEDKGVTWTKVSHGLVITQFYDVGSWSVIGTVLGGGTQDQGTNMSAGGLTWTKIYGADGGYFVVHPTDPRTMYSESQYTNIRKSTDGGNTWVTKTSGLSGSNPWTGIITMDLNNPDTLFTGTQQVFRTTDGCATPWAASSQSLVGSVTSIAVAESDSNRVYAGTTNGRVYRSDDGGATSPWAEKSTGLPSRPLKDLVVDHTDRDRVLAVFGGVNGGGSSDHVHLSTNGGDSWADISSNLPNISVNAAAFDPNDANTIYVGTDVGVYRTTDLGTTWLAFDNGLPNVIITDLHVDRLASLLVAATFGRGMYKVVITAAAEPNVDLYLRDSLLDTGERLPSPSNQPNPNDLSDQVYWWESADIKVDVTPYYSPDALFDGVEFDELTHEDPKRTEVNRFYLQVHNRGWQNATNVRVRAFLADASAGLPALPNALTPPDFNLTSTADWTPIGPAQTIPVLEPNRPVIASWDYTVPNTAATHSCLLAVVSSGEDPITTTETNVNLLVKSEKRVCLKNLHVVNGSSPAQTMATILFNNALRVEDEIDIIIAPTTFSEGTIGLLLEPVSFANPDEALDGVEIYPLREGEDIGEFYIRPGTKADVDWQRVLTKLDRRFLFEFDANKVSALRGIKMAPGQSLQGVLTFKGSKRVPHGQTQQFTVLQQQGGEIVGGSTYELRLNRAAALHPVSRIRVILEKVAILDDHDPWIKGRGEFHFTSCISFDNDACRRHYRRVPLQGTFKISDKPGKNEKVINSCVFDGYVAETDSMTLSLLPIEEDWLDPDDNLALYSRHFDGPPEAWRGVYSPDDETVDPEKLSDWMVWYRIESVPLS